MLEGSEKRSDITIELLKYGGTSIIGWLLWISNRCAEIDRLPED